MMLMNPRIRQIMPAPAGMQELAVQRRTPFSEEEADDIQVWPIVGFALVEEMQRDPNDPYGDEECECELTRVELQVVSAMVMTPRFSEIELTINIFNVDDADWRRVATLKPGEDFDDDWRTAAYEALEEEKARVLSQGPSGSVSTLARRHEVRGGAGDVGAGGWAGCVGEAAPSRCVSGPTTCSC